MDTAHKRKTLWASNESGRRFHNHLGIVRYCYKERDYHFSLLWNISNYYPSTCDINIIDYRQKYANTFVALYSSFIIINNNTFAYSILVSGYFNSDFPQIYSSFLHILKLSKHKSPLTKMVTVEIITMNDVRDINERGVGKKCWLLDFV